MEAENTMFGSSIERAGLHKERRMEPKSRENNKDKILLLSGLDQREAMSVSDGFLFPIFVLAVPPPLRGPRDSLEFC